MRHMIYLWILLGGACTFQQVAHPPFSQLDLP
jgi:hypothetical protein